MGAKFTLVALAGLLVSSLALADEMGPRGDQFYEEAAHFSSACSEDPCKAPYTSALLYNQRTRLSRLSAEQTDSLKKIAWEQAQIWGDTILEGDYASAGRTRLDSVMGYYKNNTLVGYKIQYSEKAWFTGECDYDGTPKTLNGCQEGRIVETTYVSPDMKTFFTDEDKQADFSGQPQVQ